MKLKDLSTHLGLSQTTVSRALNGFPEVSEKTRRRVEQAAAQFNYAPSNQAKALATGRAYSIGHVVALNAQNEVVNPIFSDFISGAGEVYGQNGYEMSLSIVQTVEDEAETYRKLKSRGAVDGVVLHSPSMNDPRISLLRELDLPFVVHGRATNVVADYNWVDINNRSAFQRATDFLLDLGHRRISLINGQETMDFARRRRLGFEAAVHERGLTTDPSLLISAEMTETNGFNSAKELLKRPEPPTAFLVSSMISAIGVRRAISQAGLKMGRDVSVITHDDALSYLPNGDDLPIFTATRSSVQLAGQKVAHMLLNQIANTQDKTAKTELLEAELIIGTSTGPAADR